MSNLTQLLHKLNKPLPRYTSYPTAPNWETISSTHYEEALKTTTNAPLSLYFHLPFCASMCLFCGCSVVLNRKEEKEEEYVRYLSKEIELVARQLGEKKKVSQMHFGGGTPTKLSQELLQIIFDQINRHFDIDFSEEIAIEIDPRTVTLDKGEKLKFLQKLGFNRVSFGVQDTNEKVQKAIRRNQSEKVTCDTFYLAKELGFHEINLDLIYGLPYQTVVTFQQTVETILSLKPDRIALFSYAKIPWLKPHQKAIPDESLPTTEEKFKIYVLARKAFIENGYVAIGMDHFALKESELAKSYENKTLHRNFQGYTVKTSESLLGFGMSAIGYVQNTYIQNCKELDSYYAALKAGFLPAYRGKVLSREDLIHKWVIEKIMCTFSIEKKTFFDTFGIEFDHYFSNMDFSDFEEEGLLQKFKEKIVVTPMGELFVRNIASLFDAYLQKETTKSQFSQSI